MVCENIKTYVKGKKSLNIFCDYQPAIKVIANLETSQNYAELVQDSNIFFLNTAVSSGNGTFPSGK